MTGPAIEGRKAIAEMLSLICGIIVSPKAVDRLADRRRHPLPLHGYMGRRWAFEEELRAWWIQVNFRARQLRECATQGSAGNTGSE